MKIALACDHGGLELKNHLVKFLQENGYETIDFGTNSLESCDYPDYAYKAALSIKNGEADLGIVICTSGIGVSIVANKVQTVRCALVSCVEDAISSKEHNHANCLAMGQKRVSKELAEEIVLAWLNTSYGEGRH
jgi:ribose 5-phosphate isomerase B